MSTFTAFTDFKKAYDKIDRQLLFTKLEELGLSCKFRKAVYAIYNNVECCVKVGGRLSKWFEVNQGLKQGCVLSPILFNMFINSLVTEIHALGIGVDIDGEKVAILLYADDVVLLAENEHDLQMLLDVLSNWCVRNSMTVNIDKSKVVHFRNKSVNRTAVQFMIDMRRLDVVDHYTYLGLLLTEFLDYDMMAKTVAKSAHRALGLLIAKSKKFGGFKYDTFTKLYDTLVGSVINYGAAIWGFKDYTCISYVQNRAAKYFMGVNKFTPNDAVSGDMAWNPVINKLWLCNFRQLSRFSKMERGRLNFKILYKWAYVHAQANKRNWCFKIRRKCEMLNFVEWCDINFTLRRSHLKIFEDAMLHMYIEEWKERIAQCNDGKKLRTYKLFKSEFHVEPYLLVNMPKCHRAAFAKFRCGVAPLAIETGRYLNLHVNQRVCFNCSTEVEDEQHVFMRCPLYSELRDALFLYVENVYNNFGQMSENDKFNFLFSNGDICSIVAKTCHQMLMCRNSHLYQ